MNCKKAITLMMLTGLASTTWADVVIYENSNPVFNMSTIGGCSFSCGGYTPLDFTRSSANQTMLPNVWDPIPDNSMVFHEASSFVDIHPYGMRTGPNVSIAVDDVVNFDIPEWGVEQYYPPHTVTTVDSIDGTLNYFERCDFHLWWDASNPGMVSFTPLEQDAHIIIPVSVEMVDGTHYGFVEFIGTAQICDVCYGSWQPVRWGYETDPNTAFVFPPDSCGIADFNNDGQLNFFDVSGFLNLFLANDLSADLNNDGDLNFFDVSAFLAAFSAGCP